MSHISILNLYYKNSQYLYITNWEGAQKIQYFAKMGRVVLEDFYCFERYNSQHETFSGKTCNQHIWGCRTLFVPCSAHQRPFAAPPLKPCKRVLHLNPTSGATPDSQNAFLAPVWHKFSHRPHWAISQNYNYNWPPNLATWTCQTVASRCLVFQRLQVLGKSWKRGNDINMTSSRSSLSNMENIWTCQSKVPDMKLLSQLSKIKPQAIIWQGMLRNS